ncbi:MAG: fumarylacetoacetate hydrolase family protein [Pseudomonadota bacterium]
MRLITFQKGRESAVGVVVNDQVIDLSSVSPDLPSTMRGIIAAGEGAKAKVQDIAASSSVERVPFGSLALLPVIGDAPKIFCVGLNYADHAKEGGNAVPDYPGLFMRSNQSMIAANAPIVRPNCSDTLDYEAELMVIVGKGGRHISESDALNHVFGYSIFNDGSVRAYQRKTSQWTPGKNFDGTGPVGPWIVTADELPAGAHGLKIESRLNGNVMQSSNTANMLCSVAQTIAIISEFTMLEIGDMIAMGTPEGVGYARTPPVFMQPGDVIEIEIEGIGVLRNPVVGEEATGGGGQA